MASSQLCSLKHRSEGFQEDLFFLEPRICSLIAFATVVHSKIESIILQVSAPWRRRYQKSSTFISFLFAGQDKARTLSHFHICFYEFNKSLHLLIFSWKMSGYEALVESSAPPSSWGAALMLGERERERPISICVWQFVEDHYWASVRHEQQQFNILIAEIWTHEWEQL